MSAPQQLCTFFVNGLHLGVDVLQVQEVIRAQLMTPVPLADPSVSGLINLRGHIVTAVDLRRRFAMPPRAGDIPPTNVILRTADGAVSLLVDDIGDVMEVGDATLARVPSTITGPTRALISGVHTLDGRLLLVLDPERALDLTLEA
jgi:purine-binding chemotaxis protein CheW